MEIWSQASQVFSAGMILSRARTDRMVADYDLVRGATNRDAAAMVKDAREFVDACKAKWNFEDRVTDEVEDYN
jgi:hypothetical protein